MFFLKNGVHSRNVQTPCRKGLTIAVGANATQRWRWSTRLVLWTCKFHTVARGINAGIKRQDN